MKERDGTGVLVQIEERSARRAGERGGLGGREICGVWLKMDSL